MAQFKIASLPRPRIKKRKKDDSVPSRSCTTVPMPSCIEYDRMERSRRMDATSEAGSEVDLNSRSVESPDADDQGLTTRSIEVLRGSLSRVHYRLRRGEVRAHIVSVMEQYGYRCRVRRSEYYDPALDADCGATGAISRAYPLRSTVQCTNKDGEGRFPFTIIIRGYLSKKTVGMEVVDNVRADRGINETADDPRFRDKV